MSGPGINTTFDVWWAIFMFFWRILDAIFTYITRTFTLLFSSIPESAIPFLIGIFCYSLLHFFTFLINRQDEGVRRTGMKIFYKAYIGFMICFTLWKLGVVSVAAQTKSNFETYTELVIFAVYFIFIAAVGYSFYKQEAKKVRRGILLILWALFTSITFLFAPIFEGFILTQFTLQQFLIVVVIGVIPAGLVQYQNSKKSDV